MGERIRYDASFRGQAVRLVLEQGYSVGKAATRLNMNVWTLRDWVRAAREKLSPQESALQHSGAVELNALRARVKQLEVENDILKKATAYFAKDSL